MAKKITIDIEVNGKMQKATLSAKMLREQLDGVDTNQKKTTKSAGELDRNIKGVAQTSANSAKNFSKMSQGMGGLVGVYATIAAQVFAVTAAFQLFKNATDFSNLIKGQEALGAATGIAYKTITGSIQEATDAQLGYAEAARAAAIGTSAGLSPDQLTRLGSAAKNASIALGRDLGDSFDRLVRGVVKAEPEVLDELGIILRLAPATEKYAQSIRKAADELTAFERSQAVANEVLGQAEEKFGLIEAQLDPSVAALNQFLKAFDDIKKSIFEFAAGPIASFATFLSKNIFALTGVLGLFGLSIAKTIIPNLQDWKESSKETVDLNKAKLSELRAELELTKQKYLEVNATEAGLGKGTDLIKGASKGKVPTKGALGFIAGGTTDKRAQSAAARALDNATNQIKEFGKVKSGILKKFSKEEIAILNETFLQRQALLKKGEANFKASIDGQKLKLKELGLAFDVAGAQATGFFARVSAGAARLLSAFGWIGLIVSVGTILFDLGKKVFEYFNGVDEVQKSVNEKVDATIDKYKTLNIEIQRSQQFLANNAVSGSTAVVAEAGQVQSLDVNSLIKDVNSLTDPAIKSSENYNKLREELLATAAAGSKLDPVFDKVSDAIENNRKLSEEDVTALDKVARAMGSVKTAFEQAAAQTDTTNAAIDKLINTVAKPFGSELGQQLKAELEGLQLQATALQGKLAEGITIPVDDAELNQAQEKLDAAQRRFGQGVELRLNNEGQAVGATRGGRELGNIDGRLQQYNNALAARNERQQELEKAGEAARKKTEEQLKGITDRQLYLQNIEIATTAARDDNNARLKEQRTTLDKIAKERTNGFNAAEKIKNLGLDELKNQQDLVPLRNKEAVQKALIATLEEKKKANGDKLSEIEQEQLKNAKASLEQTESEISRLEARNKLAEALNVITAERLRLQEKIAIAGNVATEIQARQKITSELQREFNIRKQIADVQRKMSMQSIDIAVGQKAINNPFFDEDRAKAKATLKLELSTLKARSDQIDLEYKNKLAVIDQEYDLLEAQKEGQALRLEALALEVRARDGAGTELEAKLNNAATNFRAIDYSKPKEAAQELALAHRDAAKLGLQKTVLDAKRTVLELEPVSKILNDAAKNFSSALSDTFTTIFDSLSDKTVDLKESLKDIGRSFVKSLQRSLIENLIVGPLTEKIGQFFSKFKFGEKFSNALGIESTSASGAGFGGLDGKGLGTTKPLLVTMTEGFGPAAGPSTGAGPETPVSPTTGKLPEGSGSETDTKIETNTKAVKENTLATTQAGLQTASMALGAIATVAALTGNEKAAKKLAIVMALLQVAVVALEVAMYINSGASLFGFRRGGIARPDMYSTGGIAKGSQSGYPALLHGTEAVVPLPNGKSIPVEMSGSGGGMQQNNVNVNVVLNQDGTSEKSSSDDGRDSAALGKSIARAVQVEIQNQKRAGGLLSPYGAI